MPSPSLLRAACVAVLATAPLALSAACALPQSGVPASQSAPVGDGASVSALDNGNPALARGGVSTTITTLGTVLTSDGFTLYRYSKDSAQPPKSTCTGKCATAWPPIPTNGLPGVTGADPAMMGSVRRPDGTLQLTVNGWPVYRYAQDLGPGSVNGQGMGGTWSALGINGEPVPTAAPAADADPDSVPGATSGY